MLESMLLGAQGWVSGLVNAFPDENRALWDLAAAGRWEEARELYRWYTPLLHLDTKVKLVQYIKLAMAETGLGSEMVRAPKLPLVGAEREEILSIIRQRHRHAAGAMAARAMNRRIHIIDSHTGGEPTRVVVAGGPDLGRGPMADTPGALPHATSTTSARPWSTSRAATTPSSGRFSASPPTRPATPA